MPLKFEAGTPAFVEAIGLGAAVDYLSALGMDAVRAHESEMTAYALERVAEVPGANIIGPTDPDIRGGVVTFTLTRFTRMIWHRCSIVRAWRFGPGIIVRNHCISGWG